MIILPQVQEIIGKYFKPSTPVNTETLDFENVSGGCINQCYRVTDSNKRTLFIKINSKQAYPGLLAKEMNGLRFLENQKIIKTPAIEGYEEPEEYQILLMNWVNQANPSNQSWKKLGEQLAALHHLTHAQFGFEEDNYMGSLPQYNKREASWLNFFVEHRLKPQIDLAIKKGLMTHQHSFLFEKLFIALPVIFDDDRPALLHGDLWRGNLLFDERKDPVLIDPAVYFGNRHMDLAMTTLFGGFDPSFYDSYHYHYTLPKNHKLQWEICNLYPLLVHANLFGESYIPAIDSILKKYS